MRIRGLRTMRGPMPVPGDRHRERCFFLLLLRRGQPAACMLPAQHSDPGEAMP